MDKKITKSKAKKWADRFSREGKGAKSVMFSKAEVLAVLNQDGCEGLRIYNAYNEDNKQTPYTMFLVGTKADGTNLLPNNEESISEDYSIWDDGRICPPDCPPNDL